MFKKAQRKKVKLKLAITGPSGSGKTYSALRLATGLGGKIAVIDTENESSSLYSGEFEFDVALIKPPYTTAKYIEAINGAVSGGYDILIIDSLSHAWEGDGGILSRKEDYDQQKGGNSFANWRTFTKEQQAFLTSILQSDISIVATMRSKQEYVISENSRGSKVPKKMGMAPVQRAGTEYEFTTVFDVSMTHKAETSKDRTGLFVGDLFQITEETGKKIKEWMDDGIEDEKAILLKELNHLKGQVKDKEKMSVIDDTVNKAVGNIEVLKMVKARLEQILLEQ